MPTLSSYDYAFVRVVPRADRGEFLNVGVILYCRTQQFLAVRVELNEERLLALDPDQDIAELREHLELDLTNLPGSRPDWRTGTGRQFPLVGGAPQYGSAVLTGPYRTMS